MLYLLSASSDEEHYLASAQAYFCITNLFSLIIRLRAAEKSDGIHYYLLSLAAGLLFGVLGRKIRRRQHSERRIFSDDYKWSGNVPQVVNEAHTSDLHCVSFLYYAGQIKQKQF